MSKDKSGFEGQRVTKGPRKKFEYSLKERLFGTKESESLIKQIKSKLCD